MKLNSIIERIGFGAKRSKSVDDVAVDKFEDFGITVGQLYQTFLKKDLSADPAIAQKIMNMVDTDDNNILTNQIKDLEFLVNQLPDKAGPKDKIGFKEVANELYSEDFKGKPFMQSTPNEFAYLDFKKWAYPRRGKIKKRLQAILDNNQADPGVPFFKELTRIWVMWANENDEAFSVVNPTDVGQKDFGRALAVMMKNDNLIINRESNKLLDLKEDDRSEKDKKFDLAQQLSKLTKSDREKLKKIQQMISKEKSEEVINGFNVPGVNESKTITEKPVEDYFSTFAGKLKKGIEDLIKNFSIDKSKGKKDKEGNMVYPINWSKTSDKDIRKIGGDVYYGDEKNKEPVKGRQRILIPPKMGWPKKQYDSKGNFKQYVFDKESDEKIKIKEFIQKTLKEFLKK